MPPVAAAGFPIRGHSQGQVARAVKELSPQLLLHRHYHVSYGSQQDATRVVGLASEEQAGKSGASWHALQLPSPVVSGTAFPPQEHEHRWQGTHGPRVCRPG